MSRRVVVAAALAQRPGVGGHTWMVLQWLLGFRALGWRPLLVDRLDGQTSRDASGEPCPPERSAGARYLAAVMDAVGLRDSWSVLLPGGETLGLGRAEVARALEASDLLLDVMGYLQDADLLARARLRVFLDIDPGFGQLWKALELHDAFAGHDRFVSVGTNLGRGDCGVPDLGLDWIPTLPPVALEHWPPVPGGDAITSVASWRGPFEPIAYEGRTYGLRVHEFRRFLALPQRTGAPFELALDIHPADAADIDRLRRHGWRLVDPRAVAGGPTAYRRYIQRSAAELNVAKNLYVDTRGGWFSDRSACYLASGKPVLAQDTGFGGALPVGAGLLAFRTLDDAVAGVEALRGEPARHRAAARAIADEHLAAGRVIPRLLDRLGVA